MVLLLYAFSVVQRFNSYLLGIKAAIRPLNPSSNLWAYRRLLCFAEAQEASLEAAIFFDILSIRTGSYKCMFLRFFS